MTNSREFQRGCVQNQISEREIKRKNIKKGVYEHDFMEFLKINLVFLSRRFKNKVKSQLVYDTQTVDSTEHQLKEYMFYSVNIEKPLKDLSGAPLNDFVHQLKLEVTFIYFLSALGQENVHAQLRLSSLLGYVLSWVIHKQF